MAAQRPITPQIVTDGSALPDDPKPKPTRLQRIWEDQMKKFYEPSQSYCRVAVLLVLWASELDELQTSGEVEKLVNVFASKFTKQNILELEDLQKEVQKSRSDVQHYLNLGWIGVCEMLAERDLGMDNLMDLWQKFHLFLLLLQHFCLKLEKILVLWENVLYLLLLYLSFSEFPNRLRPLCTTMPWTIWPVLVVL
jgi:hypothetical protein